MSEHNPKGLWDELLQAVRGWMDGEDDEQAKEQDPSLLYHLLFTAPVVIGLIALANRA